MEYEISQSIQSIEAWNAHLLRAINQDAARHEILENRDARAVLVVMDWPIKFLPRKSRKSQSDWFGKNGIPCHINVALRGNANDETELWAFAHAFESCNQESSTLLTIIDDVFHQLKEIMPEVNSVYMRSDNAGCYHCASTLLSVYHVASEHAIELRRFDFSDPQRLKHLRQERLSHTTTNSRIFFLVCQQRKRIAWINPVRKKN